MSERSERTMYTAARARAGAERQRGAGMTARREPAMSTVPVVMAEPSASEVAS